jgi:hypothetical protein
MIQVSDESARSPKTPPPFELPKNDKHKLLEELEARLERLYGALWRRIGRARISMRLGSRAPVLLSYCNDSMSDVLHDCAVRELLYLPDEDLELSY